MSLKDEILLADDLERVAVSVPKWTDKPLFVRVMSGIDRDLFEYQCFANRDKPEVMARNMRARVVALTLVDEAGERIFGDDDLAALGMKSSRELDIVYEAAAKLNGLRQSDIEELAGN